MRKKMTEAPKFISAQEIDKAGEIIWRKVQELGFNPEEAGEISKDVVRFMRGHRYPVGVRVEKDRIGLEAPGVRLTFHRGRRLTVLGPATYGYASGVRGSIYMEEYPDEPDSGGQMLMFETDTGSKMGWVEDEKGSGKVDVVFEG